MPGRGDTGDAVHVDSCVAVLGDERIARVHADANAYGVTAGPVVRDELPLRRQGRLRARLGIAEDREQLVAVRVHLDASVVGDRRAEDPACVSQQLCVDGTGLLDEARRRLHVSEEERHRAGRKARHERESTRSFAAPGGACTEPGEAGRSDGKNGARNRRLSAGLRSSSPAHAGGLVTCR